MVLAHIRISICPHFLLDSACENILIAQYMLMQLIPLMGINCICFAFSIFFFFLLGPHLQHTEVPRLGVELELQLPVYSTAIARPDPSHVCDLHHSSQQHGIPHPLSGARDQICVLMDPSQVRYH